MALGITCRQICGHSHRIKVEGCGTTIFDTSSEVPYWVFPAAAATDVVHTHAYATVVLDHIVFHANAAHRLQQHIAGACVPRNNGVVDEYVGILSQCAQDVDGCSVSMQLIITQGYILQEGQQHL